MSTVHESRRVDLAPNVRAVLEGSNPEALFLQRYLIYLESLLAQDLAGLDNTVIADSRFHELEAMGLPQGREGLRIFRHQVNSAIPDEHVLVSAVRFEGSDFIEADMVMDATQTGEIFGIPATGRRIRFEVSERCRFVDGMLAERWAQVDLDDIQRQLTTSAQ